MSESFGKTPDDNSIKEITDGAACYTATSRQSNRFSTPVLDLYFFRQLNPRQSITANAVGTYISTKDKNYYDEGKPYQYDVNGETVSVLSEAIYENRLKPFTLSTGLNYRYKYTQNDYIGDASALTKMNQNNVYAFSEIKGALKDLRYSLGAGISYIHYKQNEHNYDYWTFRPKATAAYNISRGLQLSYTYQMRDRVSVIAMTSDATIQTNSMEYTVGNPDLKPTRDTEHILELSYNTSRWQTFIEGFYKQCRKPNMALYQRTEDNKFIYTQINQKEIDMLHTMAYASYWLIPEKLQIAAYGGMQRCFNYGYDYTHFYTSWFYVGNITAYLGKFTLRAYTDNGNRWLEGEHRGFNGAQTALQTSYR
ncbi:MAG: outer membrane beta-barrel family protein, partial [Prevotella sp.]|nr:outer membrane beta-barrel family protein [Prevotella sp.]